MLNFQNNFPRELWLLWFSINHRIILLFNNLALYLNCSLNLSMQMKTILHRFYYVDESLEKFKIYRELLLFGQR